MMKRLPKACILLVLVSSVSGCAVFLPYVHPDPASRPANPSLEQALQYANDTKAMYLKALNAYAGTATIIPYAAIPMAAAGLGLGITGASGSAITALGLASGTAVAVGVWSQNKPRETAYNLGYQAITCLLKTVEPFEPAASQQFHDAIFGTSTSASLATARADLRAQIDILQGLIDAKPILEAFVQQARNYYQATEALQTDGEQLAGMASGVPTSLYNNVDTVVGKINNVIRETTPNVQAVAASIAGLSVLQPTAQPKPPAAPPATPTPPSKNKVTDMFVVTTMTPEQRTNAQAMAEKVSNAVEAVNTALKEVVRLVTVVRVALVKSQLIKDVPTLSSCLDIPDSFSVSVRVAESSVTVKQGSLRRVALAGGKGPFIATVASGPAKADDLTATAKMDGGYFVEITASDGCPPTLTDKPYKVHVTDALGYGADVSVAVEAANPVTPDPKELTIDPANDPETTVKLTGGHPGYGVGPTLPKNVTVTPIAGQNAFSVTVKKDAEEGKIVFIDSSQPPLSATVLVKKKAP